MAGSQTGSSGSRGVHIPCCGSSSCQAFLRHTIDRLQQRGVSCLTEYEPGGLYQERFQQAFDQTNCTILHVCLEILQQVQRVEQVLKNQAAKAWFVRVEPCGSGHVDPTLLLEFHIMDLSTEEKRTKFLDNLLVRFGGSDQVDGVGGDPSADKDEAQARPQQVESPVGPGDFAPLSTVLRPERPSLTSVTHHFLPWILPTAQSFRTSKPVFVDFLKNFQPRKSGVKEPGITLQRLITSLSIFGITTFLQQRSEPLSSCENFQPLCSEMVDCLDRVVSQLEQRTQSVCVFLMTPLLFSMNKTVRQRTAFLLRKHFFYHEQLWDFLLLEAILQLWPLLQARDLPLGSWTTIHQSWTAVPATFGGQSVLVHIHRPTTTEHLKHNRMREGGAVQRDQYFRELELLKEMRHESVLSLVAYHDGCCPQVYVTEDYLSTDLQHVLVNKSRSGLHFPVKRLLAMVLEALKGVEYCHEKRIVHRDLTAANVFLTREDRVKLAGFKHALKLSEKPVVRDFDLSFIATRWSAPESLRRCYFSPASDVWMIGHFLYEAMTHGRLPYADIRKSNEDLMYLVVKGQKRLCHERCIPKAIQDVIMELTAIRDSERKIPVRNIIAKLQRIMASPEFSQEDLCRFFPDLESDDQVATKHAKGPVLSLIDDFPSIDPPPQQQGEQEGDASLIYEELGAKKGSVHFVKPCPERFTMEEWDTLTQEDLPSITKLIGRPCCNDNGQRVLPFMVATSSTLYSLTEAVRYRSLGSDLGPYVQCM